MLDYHQAAPTLDNGGRILRSVVRPYPAKTAGIPLRFEYEINSGEFSFSWAIPGAAQEGTTDTRVSVNNPPLAAHPPLKSNVTEIFVPSFIAHGSKVVVLGLSRSDSYVYDEARQTLYIKTAEDTPGKVYNIQVSLSPRLRAVFFVNDFWSDWGQTVLSVGAVILALWAWILTRML